MAQRVVIGSGPDGLRAAAALADTGAQVVLLQQGPGASGLARPDLPEDDGRLRLPEGTDRAAAAAVLGPLRDAPAPALSIARDGAVRSLPLRPDAVAELLPEGSRRTAARAWVRARGRNALAELVGGGQEERTMRDWVVRRMGRPAFDALYAGYAQRRWGAPADRLAVSLARVHHFLPDAAPRVEVGGAPAEAFDAMAARVAASGEVRTGVSVQGFHVESGRVTAVVLAGGERIEAPDGVWVEDTPARAVGWLGDAASPGLVVDAGRLPAHDRVRVGLSGAAIDAGEVVHLLDEGLQAWRIVGLGSGRAVADCTLADGAAPAADHAARVAAELRGAGVGDVRPDGGAVEHERAAVALWEITTPAVLREVLGPLRAAGVVLLGARGAVAGLGPGEALALALRYAGVADPDQREAQRQLIQAPTRIDDLGARITRFLTR
jgi:hypothetical protein